MMQRAHNIDILYSIHSILIRSQLLVGLKVILIKRVDLQKLQAIILTIFTSFLSPFSH